MDPDHRVAVVTIARYVFDQAFSADLSGALTRGLQLAGPVYRATFDLAEMQLTTTKALAARELLR